MVDGEVCLTDYIPMIDGLKCHSIHLSELRACHAACASSHQVHNASFVGTCTAGESSIAVEEVVYYCGSYRSSA